MLHLEYLYQFVSMVQIKFSTGVSISIDQLNQLQEYKERLKSKMSNGSTSEEQEHIQDTEEEATVDDEDTD